MNYFIPIKSSYEYESKLNNIIASHGYEPLLTERRAISNTIRNSTFCDYTSGISSNIGCNNHGAIFMHSGSWKNVRSCADLLGLMTYTFMDDSTIKIKYVCRNRAHSRTSNSPYRNASIGKYILTFFLMCVKELSHELEKPYMVYLNATEPSFYKKCGMINVVLDNPHSNKIIEIEEMLNPELDLPNYFVWDTTMPVHLEKAKGIKKTKKRKCTKQRKKTKSRLYTLEDLKWDKTI
jgi:hypothetical protein